MFRCLKSGCPWHCVSRKSPSCADGDDARNGFITLTDSARERNRWSSLKELGTGESRCFATPLSQMASGLQSPRLMRLLRLLQ